MYNKQPRAQHKYHVCVEYWTPIRDGLLVDEFPLTSELNKKDLITFLKYNCNVKNVHVYDRP